MPLRVVEIFPSANSCLRLKWQPVGLQFRTPYLSAKFHKTHIYMVFSFAVQRSDLLNYRPF